MPFRKPPLIVTVTVSPDSAELGIDIDSTGHILTVAVAVLGDPTGNVPTYVKSPGNVCSELRVYEPLLFNV